MLDYYAIPAGEFRSHSPVEFHFLDTHQDLCRAFARELVDLIRRQAARGELAGVILPVGPLDYRPFAELCNAEGVSCASLVVFAMDEYCLADGTPIPESHPLSYGMLGMHGMAYANMAVNEADLIIAIGMRFDDRATGKVSAFAPHAHIIHIDIDPAEIGKNIRVDIPIVGDAKAVLQDLNKQVTPTKRLDWTLQLDVWRRDHPAVEIRDTHSLLPQYVVRKIYEKTRGEAVIVTGVGQNQMWAAQHYWYDRPRSLITSGGLGTMGFELPGAIGAKIGRPDDTVWCIAGDGGFQMTLHELATAVQEKVEIKIAILNNGYLGMVRQWQELFYKKQYVATVLSGPDFVKLGEAYGVPGVRVKRKAEVEPAIERAMDTKGGPFLIDFVVEPEENVYPMVPPGAALSECIEEPCQPVKAVTDSTKLKASNI